MKRTFLILTFMLCYILVFSEKKEIRNYSGVENLLSIESYIQASAFAYTFIFKTRFSNETFLSQHFSLDYGGYTGLQLLISKNILIGSDIYPEFHFGGKKVSFFISTPGIDYRAFIYYGYFEKYTSNFKITKRYYKTNVVFSGFLAGKTGINVFIGKNQNVLLTTYFKNGFGFRYDPNMQLNPDEYWMDRGYPFGINTYLEIGTTIKLRNDLKYINHINSNKSIPCPICFII